MYYDLIFGEVKLDDGKKSSNSHKNWHENTFKACTTWFSSHFPTHSVFFFYILLVYKWENQFQIGYFRQTRFKEIWEVKRRLAEIVKRNMNFAVFHITRSADLLWKSAVGDVHNG